MRLSTLFRQPSLLPIYFGFCLILQGSTLSFGQVKQPNQLARPNILLFIADDMGWGDVSCHGGQVPTPNIDSLTQSGIELKRYYTYPLCSPTRAALLTGVIPKRFGIINALQPRDKGLPAGLPTLPRTLQAAGYQTMAVGKWHVGYGSPPLDSGFDHFYGFLGPEIDYFQHTSRNGQVDWQRNRVTLKQAGYSTELLAAEAVHLIEQRDAQRPFYLHVAFNAPHFPLAAPPEYLAKVAHLPRAQAVRAAVIDAFDNAIGRILEALDIDGPWKLIEFSNGSRALFNVITDPQETNDLAVDEVERVQVLSEKLKQFYER